MSATLAAPRAGLFRRLLENPGAVAGLAVMAVLIAVAIAAPLIAPHGPAEQFRDHFLASPFQQATCRLSEHHRSFEPSRATRPVCARPLRRRAFTGSVQPLSSITRRTRFRL